MLCNRSVISNTSYIVYRTIITLKFTTQQTFPKCFNLLFAARPHAVHFYKFLSLAAVSFEFHDFSRPYLFCSGQITVLNEAYPRFFKYFKTPPTFL